MITKIITTLILTMIQNASFTLVSRARNSDSIMFHAFASVTSNAVWIVVIKQVVQNFDNWIFVTAYIVGSTAGAIWMHHISMKYLEKWKIFQKKPRKQKVDDIPIKYYDKDRRPPRVVDDLTSKDRTKLLITIGIEDLNVIWDNKTTEENLRTRMREARTNKMLKDKR